MLMRDRLIAYLSHHTLAPRRRSPDHSADGVDPPCPNSDGVLYGTLPCLPDRRTLSSPPPPFQFESQIPLRGSLSPPPCFFSSDMSPRPYFICVEQGLSLLCVRNAVLMRCLCHRDRDRDRDIYTYKRGLGVRVAI